MSKTLSLIALALFTMERKIFMRQILMLAFAAVLTSFTNPSMAAPADDSKEHRAKLQNVQVGPRPYFLVDDLDPGSLKKSLQQCADKPLRKTDFRSAIAAPRCSFPNIQKSLTKPPLAWGPESLSAT